MNSVERSDPTADLVARLLSGYQSGESSLAASRTLVFPSASEIQEILADLRQLLFPGIADGSLRIREPTPQELSDHVAHLSLRIARQIALAQNCVRTGSTPTDASPDSERDAARITQAWLGELPEIRLALIDDARAALAGDPAAGSLAEVVLCYPGHYAISVHRLAHVLLRLGVPLLPRMMSECAHRATGIDIHPGAEIGPSFFIDHGTGVVVGATTHIGARVRLYQGVTLGALSLPAHKVAEIRGGPQRHPTLEDDVIVYAGATILGGETVIGRGSVIGGSAWVTSSVPPDSRVSVQISSEVKPGRRSS